MREGTTVEGQETALENKQIQELLHNTLKRQGADQENK